MNKMLTTKIGLDIRSTIMLYISVKNVSMINTRRFSTRSYIDTALMLSAIESVYKENEAEWRFRGILPFRKDYLMEVMIRDNYYPLSRLNYYLLNRSDFPDFMYFSQFLESKRGFIWLGVTDDTISVYQPGNSCDLLVFMALSRVIITDILVDVPPIVDKLSDLKWYHYDFLNRQRNVIKIIHIDLYQSINTIDKSRILSNLKYLESRGIVYNLIKQFIHLPTFDYENRKCLPLNGLPRAGEITNVILDVFYQNVFETAIEDMYPGITFTRWGHEVFIAIKANDSFTFNELTASNFLKRINLHGHIECLYLADDRELHDISYLVGSEQDRVIFLESNGTVSVWKSEDV